MAHRPSTHAQVVVLCHAMLAVDKWYIITILCLCSEYVGGHYYYYIFNAAALCTLTFVARVSRGYFKLSTIKNSSFRD